MLESISDFLKHFTRSAIQLRNRVEGNNFGCATSQTGALKTYSQPSAIRTRSRDPGPSELVDVNVDAMIAFQDEVQSRFVGLDLEWKRLSQ